MGTESIEASFLSIFALLSFFTFLLVSKYSHKIRSGALLDKDFLNKRAIYVYVREISGLTPKKLSVSMSSIRKHYRDIVHDKRIVDIF